MIPLFLQGRDYYKLKKKGDEDFMYNRNNLCVV